MVKELVLPVVTTCPADFLLHEFRYVEQSLRVTRVCTLKSPRRASGILWSSWLTPGLSIEDLGCGGLRSVIEVAEDDNVSTAGKQVCDVLA